MYHEKLEWALFHNSMKSQKEHWFTMFLAYMLMFKVWEIKYSKLIYLVLVEIFEWHMASSHYWIIAKCGTVFEDSLEIAASAEYSSLTIQLQNCSWLQNCKIICILMSLNRLPFQTFKHNEMCWLLLYTAKQHENIIYQNCIIKLNLAICPKLWKRVW